MIQKEGPAVTTISFTAVPDDQAVAATAGY
jgi:hypothetical protein